MKYPSHIELSRKALTQNIRYLRRRIGPRAEFTSVIKGNAYGHGLRPFLKLAEDCDVRSFAVSDAYEASLALEVKRPESRLMIMGLVDDVEVEWAVVNDVEFWVFEFGRLETAVETAGRLGKPARIHLEVETGMNRTGFERTDWERVADYLRDNRDRLELRGICTHYAGAESVANYLRILNQYQRFKEAVEFFAERDLVFDQRHTACSAAALTYPQTIMDTVRFGIAQYGFWPSRETRMYNLLSDDTRFTIDPLRRVLSWKSKVMSLKRVPPGEFVSYGTSCLADRHLRLAVIPVGYRHGFSRSLSNLGHVLIRGRKAPVRGLVNMNMFLVDVGHIHGVRKGDEVVLIGRQKRQAISVSSFSDLAKHVNYELLTRLPAETPRLIMD
ncbi:MAG: alanine racemase [Candidatus Coatesbacteria bacterium]|nr:alanine racemase [Candidatus Coatesbacteria bacterium]